MSSLKNVINHSNVHLRKKEEISISVIIPLLPSTLFRTQKKWVLLFYIKYKITYAFKLISFQILFFEVIMTRLSFFNIVVSFTVIMMETLKLHYTRLSEKQLSFFKALRTALCEYQQIFEMNFIITKKN